MARTNLSPGNVGNVPVSLKSSLTVSAGNAAIFQTPATLEAYLVANGYTAATLGTMTENDMVYAARLKLSLI